MFVLSSVSFDGYCVCFWGVCVFLGGGGREEGFWERQLVPAGATGR